MVLSQEVIDAGIDALEKCDGEGANAQVLAVWSAMTEKKDVLALQEYKAEMNIKAGERA
jgi:hypothetical protein